MSLTLADRIRFQTTRTVTGSPDLDGLLYGGDPLGGAWVNPDAGETAGPRLLGGLSWPVVVGGGVAAVVLLVVLLRR